MAPPGDTAVAVRAQVPAEPAPPSEGQSAARDAGVFIYSRIAASVLDFVAFVLAARIFPKDGAGFAYLAYALMIHHTALALGSLGLPDAVYYFLGVRPGRGGAVVRQTSFLLLVAVLPVIGISAAVVFLGSPKVDIRDSFFWLALFLALELPTQPAVNLLISEGQAGLASAFYVLFAVARAAGIMVPALLGYDASQTLPALAVGGVVRLVVHLWVVRRFFPKRGPWFELGELRAILYFAVPAGLAAMCGLLNAQIDKYFVALVLGAQAMADYAVGSWEVPLVTLLPYAIGSILQPRYVKLFAARRKDELVSLWHETVRTTALLVVPTTILIIVLAPDLLVLVFSAKYQRATLPFQIFSLIMLHRVASYGAFLQAVGDTRSLLISSVLMVGTNIAINYPLLVWLGFPGAALATLFSNVPAFIYTLRRISVGLAVPISQTMPWRSYLSTLAACTGTGVALWLVLQVTHFPPVVNFAAGTVLYAVASFLVMRSLNLIKESDVAYLRRWLAFKLLREP